MKKAIVAGIIAGLITGVVTTILSNLGIDTELPILSYRLEFSMIPTTPLTIAVIEITLGVIWGIIFGVLYAIFYDYIPSKGVKKGFIFGLIFWTAGSIRPAALAAAHALYFHWALAWTFFGFLSICIIYGLVLGLLYRKPSE